MIFSTKQIAILHFCREGKGALQICHSRFDNEFFHWICTTTK